MFRPLSLKNNTVKFAFLIILAGVFLCLGKFFSVDKETYQSFLSGFPVAVSGFIFVILYVIVTFFIWVGPKDILRIIAAVVYGVGLSTFLVWIAEMTNVVVLFSFSRRLGQAHVAGQLSARLKRLDQTIAGTSFWRIFFLRLFPVVPLRFLDLGFGLTRISLKKYFTISFLGTPLRIFFVQFFLTLGTDTLMNPGKLRDYLAGNKVALWMSFIYLAGSVLTIFILRSRWAANRSGQDRNSSS